MNISGLPVKSLIMLELQLSGNSSFTEVDRLVITSASDKAHLKGTSPSHPL